MKVVKTEPERTQQSVEDPTLPNSEPQEFKDQDIDMDMMDFPLDDLEGF